MKILLRNSTKKEPITIRINEEKIEKIEKIDKLAVNANVSRSEFINQCIDFAIDNMLPSESKSRGCAVDDPPEDE